MPAAHAKVIGDLLEEHFEELDFLWGRRQAALSSPVLTVRDLLDLEERIEAHVEGLLLGGEDTVQLLVPGLLDSSSNVAFASAYPLLRLGQTEATQHVWDAFGQAQGEALTGLCQALCACCPPELKPRMVEAAADGASHRAAAAVEVLAFCSPKDVIPGAVASFLRAGSPRLCQAGWRIVALANVSIPREQYEKALSDEDPDVRRECLWAAAWTRQPWVLDYSRKYAAKDLPADTHPFRLLAILGQSDDLQRMLYLGKDTAFGPQRFQWLGAYGHPQTVDLILLNFGCQNPRDAVAAGGAFTKITGYDVSSDNRVQLPPEDGSEPDEFEREFLDEVCLPDLNKARAHWQNVKDRFAKGARWCCGYDFTELAVNPNLRLLDLESQHGILLRAKYLGTWPSTLADIHRLRTINNLEVSQ